MSSSSRIRNPNVGAAQDRTAALTDLRHSLVLHVIFRQGALSIDAITEALSLPHAIVADLVARLSESGLLTMTGDTFDLALETRQRLSFRSLSLEFLVDRPSLPT